MKKKITLLTLSLLTISTFSQNLISNGDLELWSNETPDGWSTISGDIEQETSIVNDGSNSIAFTPMPADFSSPTSAISQNFILDNTEEYVVKFDYFVPGTNFTDNPITLISLSLDNNTPSSGFFTGSDAGRTSIIVSDETFADVPLVRGEWTTVEYQSLNVLVFWEEFTEIDIELQLRVNALDQDGSNKVYIDNVRFEPVNSTLSNNDIQFNDLSIYPNPTADKLIFKNNNNLTNLQIFDYNAKLVKTIPNLSNQDFIDVQDLAGGLYILKYENRSNTVIHKFIKK